MTDPAKIAAIAPARCEALVSYGDAWTAGRKRCANNAVKGMALCGVHLKQKARRTYLKEQDDEPS